MDDDPRWQLGSHICSEPEDELSDKSKMGESTRCWEASAGVPIFFRCGRQSCHQGRLGGVHAYVVRTTILIRRHDNKPGESSGGQFPFGEDTLENRCAVTILVNMLRLYVRDASEKEYEKYENMLKIMKSTALEDLADRIDKIFYMYASMLYIDPNPGSDSDY